MDRLSKDPILQFNSDTLESLRKQYNLDNHLRMEEAIQMLENWVAKQNHFTQKKFDREYLERTLIHAKGSVERAKSLLEHMCTFRTLLPKYFTNCNIKEDLRDILDKGWVVPLPKMTKDHCRVYVVKFDTSAIKPGDFVSFCMWNIITCEYLKTHDYFQGIILIEDYRKVNLYDLMSKISIAEMQEMTAIIIKGFGVRLKAIHVINEFKATEFILQIIKQLVKPKIISRVKFHSEISTLGEYVDPSILPGELGGTEISLKDLRNEWIDCLSSEEHTEYMKKMNQARTDEANRLADEFNSLYMGTPGAFRNLVVD